MPENITNRKAEENEKREADQQLDEALEETFPGSDAVSVTQPIRRVCEPPGPTKTRPRVK